MLKIKLSRVGKKHQPEYRVVVMEHTRDPWGPAKEILGYYNPRTSPSTVDLKKDRIEYWLSVGAQATETVQNILIGEGILKGKKAKSVTISKKRAAKQADKAVAKADAEAQAAPPTPAAAEEPAPETATEEPAAPEEEKPAEPEPAPAE